MTTRTDDPTSATVEAAAPAEAPPSRRARVTIACALAGTLLATLDTTVVNVALHSVTERFGTIDKVQWIVTGYLLALVATMPLAGWLAARVGPGRAYLGAIVLFGIGSALCALSPSLELLVASRVLSGAAAGIIIPLATVLVARDVSRDQFARVQALNGSIQLIGPLLGPTVGGLLIEVGGWPAVFWLNVPVCLVIVCAGVFIVGPRPTGRPRPLDVLGLFAGATATVCAVSAISALSQHDSLRWVRVIALAVISAVALVLFVLRENRIEHPLLDLGLMRHRIFARASVNVFLLGFLLYAPMVVIPLYFSAARGESSVTTGLLLSTAGLGVLVSGSLCPRLMRRWGAGRTMILGIVATFVATVPLVTLSDVTSYPLLCGLLVVRGAGIGLAVVAVMTRAYQSSPAESIADAAAQLNLLQRIGGALAAAIVSLVLSRAATEHGGLVSGAFAQTSWWLVGAAAVTLVPAIALARAEVRSGA